MKENATLFKTRGEWHLATFGDKPTVKKFKTRKAATDFANENRLKVHRSFVCDGSTVAGIKREF